MKASLVYTVLVPLSTLCFAGPASSADGHREIRLSARLTGFNEVTPKFTSAAGKFSAVIDRSAETETLYIDGVPMAGPSSIAGLGSVSSTNALWFDRDFDPLVGALDEARIYGRALSDTEVAGLFASPGSR